MDNSRNILVSGASFAGLSTAYWMKEFGYRVTVVEIAEGLKRGGTPVNIRNNTVAIVKRMGLFEQIRAQRINMEGIEFKNSADVTEGWIPAGATHGQAGEQSASEEYEIERDTLLAMLFDAVKNDVEFIFGDSVVSLEEANGISVSFAKGPKRTFDLVFGCDGMHSAVRRLWFGDEQELSRFLHAYFSITIVDKLLIRQNTSQLYNEPGIAVMLNAYNKKTDIVLCFASDEEIPYNYRDEAQQRQIITERFSGQGWRVPELLDEVQGSRTFYFDKLCQITMPSWTKGRVALVGDAGYCASPAAGMGGSLAIDGAGALAQAFEKCGGDYESAFREYNTRFRPFIEQVQADAASFGVEILVPRTREAIRRRNTQAAPL